MDWSIFPTFGRRKRFQEVFTERHLTREAYPHEEALRNFEPAIITARVALR